MYERILPRLGAASGALFVVALFGASSTGSDSTAVLVLELLGLLVVHPLPRLPLERPPRGRGPGRLARHHRVRRRAGRRHDQAREPRAGKAADDFGDATPIHKALDDMNSAAFIATMLPLGVLMAAVASSS